jgi:hypothetical protein
MDIKGEITPAYYENICNYIEIINNKDSFSIFMDNVNKNNISIVYKILDNNKFKIHNEGYNGKGIYHINAYKR